MRRYVGAKIMGPDGEIVTRYRKMRLVPFGEYVPALPFLGPGAFPGIERLVESVSDFTPGSSPTVGNVMGVPTASFICYEAIFPSLVRRFVANGAELLVNITNDGWYGTSSAPYQHFAMARFRAVENRRYLVRAANTGISAVIDPVGRVVAETALFERRALLVDVSAVPETTFYSRNGDVFAWSVFSLTLLLWGWAEASLRSPLRSEEARNGGRAAPLGHPIESSGNEG
jgi:apolipoprotein N-acyltransferase